MANQGLGNKFFANDGSPTIEAYYGPYPDVASALAAIPSAFRQVGRKVGIRVGNNIKEYRLDGFDDSTTTGRDNITTTNIKPLEDTMTIAGGGGGSAGFDIPNTMPVAPSDVSTYLNTNYSSEALEFKVYDTTNGLVYTKIGANQWTKQASVSPDVVIDPEGVIQGISLISVK